MDALLKISKSYLLRSYESAIQSGILPPSTDPHQLIKTRLGQPIHLSTYKRGQREVLGYLSDNNIIKKVCESSLQLSFTANSLRYVLSIEEIQEAKYELLFNQHWMPPAIYSQVQPIYSQVQPPLLKILSHAERVIRLNKSLIFYSRTTWQNNDRITTTMFTSAA
jgi:hypothetical protein